MGFTPETPVATRFARNSALLGSLRQEKQVGLRNDLKEGAALSSNFAKRIIFLNFLKNSLKLTILKEGFVARILL
jgi:hypothetical protein